MSDIGAACEGVIAARIHCIAVTGPASFQVIDALVKKAAAESHSLVIVDLGSIPGEAPGPGLSDLIAGTAEYGQIIRRNPLTRAHEIGCGTAPLPEDAATVEAVQTMLNALKHAYDLVVLHWGRGAPDVGQFGQGGNIDHVLLAGAQKEEIKKIAMELTASGMASFSLVSEVSSDISAVA